MQAARLRRRLSSRISLFIFLVFLLRCRSAATPRPIGSSALFALFVCVCVCFQPPCVSSGSRCQVGQHGNASVAAASSFLC